MKFAIFRAKAAWVAWLEKGYEERDSRMSVLSEAVEFDGVRSDPRFKDLVRRIGLPE